MAQRLNRLENAPAIIAAVVGVVVALVSVLPVRLRNGQHVFAWLFGRLFKSPKALPRTFFFFASLCFLVGAGTYVESVLFARKAVATTGLVTEIRQIRRTVSGRRGIGISKYHPYPVLWYRDAAGAPRVAVNARSRDDVEVRASVPMCYDPDDPVKVKIANQDCRDVDRSDIIGLAAFGAAFAAVGAFLTVLVGARSA